MASAIKKQKIIGSIWALYTIGSFAKYFHEFGVGGWGYNKTPFILKTTFAEQIRYYVGANTLEFSNVIYINTVIYTFLLALCCCLIFDVKYAKRYFFAFLVMILLLQVSFIIYLQGFGQRIPPSEFDIRPLLYKTYTYIAIIISGCFISGWLLYLKKDNDPNNRQQPEQN